MRRTSFYYISHYIILVFIVPGNINVGSKRCIGVLILLFQQNLLVFSTLNISQIKAKTSAEKPLL